MSRVDDTEYASCTFLLNRCCTGGIHFKQYKFLTSLPCAFTNHMELECDHYFEHPPCLGRDVNGNSVTCASGVYTDHMVYMLAVTIGRLTSHNTPLMTVRNALHAHIVLILNVLNPLILLSRTRLRARTYLMHFTPTSHPLISGGGRPLRICR